MYREITTCAFTNPRNADNVVPTGNMNFAYASSTCVTTSTTTLTVLDISTSTATSSRAYDGPTYHEWLLVAGVFLFFLTILSWKRLSIFKS